MPRRPKWSFTSLGVGLAGAKRKGKLKGIMSTNRRKRMTYFPIDSPTDFEYYPLFRKLK